MGALSLVVTGRGFNKALGQREWILCFISFSLSLSSLYLRLNDAYLASVLFGHFFQFVGYYLLGLGALRYLGHDFKDHWVMVIFLVLHLGLMTLLSVEDNFLNARLAVVAFVAGTFSLGITLFFRNFSKNRNFAETGFMYLYGFHAAFSFCKGILNLVDHDRVGLFSRTFVSQVTFYEYVILTIGMIIFLNVMVHQQIKTQHVEK
ncbi:hypothetical protein [Candidatus Terasakiella magnetica]|uniref:hypothetical protein n=1 Tax=Candidatus Terasakiella magnetica TaxID=1867952 RepID=UPI000F83C42C|nr:hypothetical protein [Candidatus Terasakiella magnetica]